MARILVTGGAGFIGSNFVHFLLREQPDAEVIVLDKLTYAGNLENLEAVRGDPRFRFVRGDIADPTVVRDVMSGCDQVYNFAAESHVDRSIQDAEAVVWTNVRGTQVLLDAARELGVARYVQVSTDEVYGSIGSGHCSETDLLRPSNPYAACKAAGDLLALAAVSTWKLDAVVTRSSNNYGLAASREAILTHHNDRANRCRSWRRPQRATGCTPPQLPRHRSRRPAWRCRRDLHIGAGNSGRTCGSWSRSSSTRGDPDVPFRARSPRTDFAMRRRPQGARIGLSRAAASAGLAETVRWYQSIASVDGSEREFAAYYRQQYAPAQSLSPDA
jgi:hypothetical protein